MNKNSHSAYMSLLNFIDYLEDRGISYNNATELRERINIYCDSVESEALKSQKRVGW